MTETPTTESTAPPRKKGGALGGKVLAELKEIAAELNIEGASTMRKGQLIDAIKTARGDAPPSVPKQSAPAQQELDVAQEDAKSAPADKPRAKKETRPAQSKAAQSKAAQSEAAQSKAAQSEAAESKPAESKQAETKPAESGADSSKPARQGDEAQGGRNRGGNAKNDDNRGGGRGGSAKNEDRQDNNGGSNGGNRGGNAKNDDRQDNNGGNRGGNAKNEDRQDTDRDEENSGGGRRRNRRGRNRGNRGPDGEPSYTEDDVLVPAAGILDILDNYAFVRTTGYLPSENDVYLSLSMVRKLGLRKGDAVTGQVRQPREGERKEKFNPMVRIDTVNGATAEESRHRVDFSKVTPLFPTERLNLQTESSELTTRIVDLFAPIGKGQRGLIVSPPKAGKTMVLQAVANAITANNPECHLMVVLVDERPEEVTEMQRTVKGEVIASTFDRPASDHTTVAELAIERAKRLVELGHDVVVLLDSITRLGRAYHQTASSSSRSSSGHVDASALYPSKRFFGAARNLEDGGSLTILATALVETGSRTDEVIFEEFQDTANMELRLRRDFADRRIFPAIDVEASSTRREELLLGSQELSATSKLRRLIAGQQDQQGLELIIDRLTKSPTNEEFLRQANQTIAPNGVED
ncbi:transcription termination factor Rho [Aeromicrobium sp. CTD01-1L150]|uniref:transcription termination factor Rho n=1 Tax=Aeromicrobium sp. CTD01-1L150 TaxID=3341830 RepID=UPI0035C038D5